MEKKTFEQKVRELTEEFNTSSAHVGREIVEYRLQELREGVIEAYNEELREIKEKIVKIYENYQKGMDAWLERQRNPRRDLPDMYQTLTIWDFTEIIDKKIGEK